MRLLAASLVLAAVSSANASVVNGGFEAPGTGFRSVGPGQTWGNWTCAGPNDIEFVHATQNPNLPGLEFSAYEGSYWIDLTGVGAPSAIYQDVATTAGQMYDISFALSGNPYSGPQIMNLSVLWNGAVVGTFSHNTTGHSGQDMGWTLRSVIVTGTGNDRLTFRGTSGVAAAGAAIDAVSMVPVPAPAGVAFIVPAALLAARRRRGN